MFSDWPYKPLGVVYQHVIGQRIDGAGVVRKPEGRKEGTPTNEHTQGTEYTKKNT